jgi:hypothetical protein
MRTILMVALAAAPWIGAAPLAEIKIPAADREEVMVRGSALSKDDKGNVSSTGRSEFIHGALSVTCVGTAVVRTAEGYFSSLDAVGTIEAKSGKKVLRGQRLEYEATRHLVTLSGGPEVADEGTTYRAERRILVYLETGVVQCEPKTLISINRSFHKENQKPERRKFLGLF